MSLVQRQDVRAGVKPVLLSGGLVRSTQVDFPLVLGRPVGE